MCLDSTELAHTLVAIIARPAAAFERPDLAMLLACLAWSMGFWWKLLRCAMKPLLGAVRIQLLLQQVAFCRKCILLCHRYPGTDILSVLPALVTCSAAANP